MAEYQNILVEVVRDFIGDHNPKPAPDHEHLHHPDRGQSFTDALMELDQDPKVRVVVIKAEGRAFCAGIDVNEMEGKNAHQLKEWVEHMERPLAAMAAMKKPVITSVQGVAAANGAGLVVASDMCVASEKVPYRLHRHQGGVVLPGPGRAPGARGGPQKGI